MSDSERGGEIGTPKEISHTGVAKEELSETDETRLSDKDSAPSNGVENQMSNVISVGEKGSAQPDGIENHTTSQSDVIENHTTALSSIQENDMAQSDGIENPLITVNASPEKHSSQSGDLENHITGVHSSPDKDSVHPNGNNNNMSALNLTEERNTAHTENEGPRSSDGGIIGDEGGTETGDLKKGEGSGNLPVESDSLVNDEELLEAGTEGKISRESQNGVIEKELDPEMEMHLVTLENGDMRTEREYEENDNSSSSEESEMELCHEDDLMEEVDDGNQDVEMRGEELVSMVTGTDLPSDNELIEEADNTVSRMAMLDDNNIKEEQLQPPDFSKGNAVEVKRPINLFLLGPDATEDEETGTPEEQLAFMKELETFHKEKFLEFKPPRFYGEPLNCLKLFRAVVRLGGYEQVTSCKYWRQVGESFKPPKTCTTVSWTFRCFYEKALLEYEKHKMHCGELPFSDASVTEQTSCGNQPGVHQTLGSGRTRRDAAARAMQGWHSQRNLGNGEVGDAIIKDKNSTSTPKREKTLKSIGLLKRKRPSPVDRAVKVAHLKVSKTQESDTMVVDVGPPADWVKINVQRTKDCFELYALVPGLLREEVRVQSDPAGRLVITGEPGQLDNPWGVTSFKKVVTLPSRIDPHQTSAVVTLHGQLFVRIPFEQSDM